MEKCALLWPATRGTAQAEPASPTNLQRRSQTLSLTRPVHIRDTSMPTIIPSLLPTRSNAFRLLPSSRLALTSLFTTAVGRHDR
ncbi:hypothetical protein RB213_003968 [Colletotrichum asianum]|uniref:Uncharacterized protein n=1 Tax=Colletotrichum asianum TaxID=702518 RepID=A0A8H3ZJY0_9PEZI|nr:hypothetical protein GQ607_010754 [Colletotrichum asianum]